MKARTSPSFAFRSCGALSERLAELDLGLVALTGREKRLGEQLAKGQIVRAQTERRAKGLDGRVGLTHGRIDSIAPAQGGVGAVAPESSRSRPDGPCYGAEGPGAQVPGARVGGASGSR